MWKRWFHDNCCIKCLKNIKTILIHFGKSSFLSKRNLVGKRVKPVRLGPGTRRIDGKDILVALGAVVSLYLLIIKHSKTFETTLVDVPAASWRADQVDLYVYIYIWIVLYGSERHSPLLKDMVLVVPHFWSGIHNFLDRPPLTRATCSGQRNMAQGCETAKLRHGFKASATSKCDLLVSEELYAFITWLFWNMIRIMQVSCIIIVTMVYDIW